MCQYWRQVALGTPSLWSTVAETPPTDSKVWCRAPFWRYYVHRCTDGPLYVDINTRCSVETVALASRYRDRVRKLSITVDSNWDYLKDNNLMALSDPFPNIEHCQIIFTPASATLFNRSASKLISTIFPQSCGSLRCLVLAGSTFVPSDSFPSLTSLKYSFPGYGRGVHDMRFVWTRLLGFLSGCKALVSVGLYGMGVLASEALASTTETIEWAPLLRRVELPNLEELGLHDRCQSRYSHGYLRDGRTYQSRASDMLTDYRISVPRAIYIPRTCRINIGIINHPQDVEKLYAVLLDRGSGTGPSIARVTFQLDSEVETGLKLSVDTANLDSPEPERTHVDLETVYSVPSWEQDPKYRPTISSLPFFARLRELWIDADAHAAFMRVDLASCALNLAELAQLETLVVRRRCARASAAAPLRESDGNPDGPCLQEGGGWEDRPTLATARDLLKSLEPQPQPQAAADPTGDGHDAAGPLACPCPFLATLRVDVIGFDVGLDEADEAGYVRGLAARRGAVGCLISRLLVGVIFRDDFMLRPYVVSQYDAEGQLAGAGNHEADGLAEHWRQSLPHS